jgi:hypothetical protein
MGAGSATNKRDESSCWEQRSCSDPCKGYKRTRNQCLRGHTVHSRVLASIVVQYGFRCWDKMIIPDTKRGLEKLIQTRSLWLTTSSQSWVNC